MYSNICCVASIVCLLVMFGSVYRDYGKAVTAKQVLNYVLWFIAATIWMIWGAVIDAI